MAVKRPLSPYQFPGSLLPVFILLGGIVLSLWLLTFSQQGVVFSGDGGLKALLTQQLAQQISGDELPLDVSLNLPASDWVKALWQQGLYPFTPPFVYAVGSQHFITFPFTFPLVSAPFYALFGDRGLYVVPLLSLWAIWGRFWQIGRRAGWSLGALCIGLVSLVFASPLTLYGGMFWEHTLAVALAFAGVSALLFPRTPSALPTSKLGPLPITRHRALGSGILMGLAVWFRPEFLCLVAAVGLLALIGWRQPHWRLAPPLTLVTACILIGAMACTVGIFFALNYGIYGHPLGIHAIQIVEESSVKTQIVEAADGYRQMLSSLGRYFPVAVFVLVAALVSPELKKTACLTTNRFRGYKTPNVEALGISRLPSADQTNAIAIRFSLAVCLLFALSVPLIVPPGAGGKQWGPRFYLILVPLLSAVLAEQLQPQFFRRWARPFALVGAAIVLILGIQLNTLQGAFASYRDGKTNSISLLGNYAPIAPAIAQLHQEPSPWVAMSHEYVAQQLWSALPEKTFFRAETPEQVKQLAAALRTQDQQTFLYVCYPHEKCPTPEAPAQALALADGSQLRFDLLGEYGKYPLYQVTILTGDNPS